MTTLSESSILDLIADFFPEQHPSFLLGRGDDCAVLYNQSGLCVSTDLFIEDVHFRKAYFTPQEVGHKALAVNISDLAAMGVRPMSFSLGLAIPASTSMDWVRGFFTGMSTLARKYGMGLSGGDISRAEKITICITVWGEGINPKQLPQNSAGLTGEYAPSQDYVSMENTGKFLTRGGAMPGDSLFLIGQIGLARIGLEELEKNGLCAKKQWPAATAALLEPSPLVDAGLILSRSSLHMRPPVLMDVSDGLARDVPRLLGIDKQGPLGAQLVLPKTMLHEEVIRHAQENKRNAVTEAWIGGEDYALLGACVPKLLPILHAAIPHLHSIGIITDSGRIELNSVPMAHGYGFDHFAPRW